MAKNSAASLLTSVDSLFTTQEERDIASQPRVQEIPVDKIDDFPNHPFKVRMDDNMIEMAESVKQHGILVPAIVRPKENGHYEMVAGHRRKLACTLIAKLQLPCIVRELTDEEATDRGRFRNPPAMSCCPIWWQRRSLSGKSPLAGEMPHRRMHRPMMRSFAGLRVPTEKDPKPLPCIFPSEAG